MSSGMFIITSVPSGKVTQALKFRREKTAKATQLSEKWVKRIRRQASECNPNPFSSPVYCPKKLCVRDKLDDFDKKCIRYEVLSREIPTIEALLERVRDEPVKFEGRKTTPWKVMREIRFKYA
ncbi:hypothetical protein Pcinc_005381 [Petrolisthes cinctipes]|uniref:Uncharacterized protein n=1 Tax=Petrolisthes cinctipes TaxID=88211 RepID=A0AAE1GFA2_PETCI|nr:hypothetical protein Pcinc_005381 [Petrolisthes cinctipes]